ncbi:hypothetical protein KJ836_02610 [Patescibacteria group bacterium]|nr:hypothetical protein [Patescibacteria group bacterium]
MTKSLSDHDLLLRIDERQRNIKNQVNSVKNSLNCVVKTTDDDYIEIRTKVDSMWDSKNKMIGWMLGAGIAGGGIATFMKTLTIEVLGFFQ